MRVGVGGAMGKPGWVAGRTRVAVVEVEEMLARDDVTFRERDELEERNGELLRW